MKSQTSRPRKKNPGIVNRLHREELAMREIQVINKIASTGRVYQGEPRHNNLGGSVKKIAERGIQGRRTIDSDRNNPQMMHPLF